MKKYLIISFSIVLLILLYFYLNFSSLFFISLNKKVKTNVYTKDKDIIFNDNKFSIKAINLGSSFPNHSTKDYSISYDTYLEWFKLIQEMNINTIRVFNIESPAFYKALKNYNENNKPIYLLQGIDIDSYYKNSKKDYFEVKKYLIKNAKKTVDVIHGKSIITYNGSTAYGEYLSDVSDYTIGYIVGIDWNDSTIMYTDKMNRDKTNYNGKYLSTNDATPFERILAEVGDKLIEYESKKYGEQRLISFGNEPITDPFTYDEAITDFFNKFASFDVSNIECSSKFLSGLFASFRAYSDYPDFYKYSTNETEDTYYKYLKSLYDYYNIPLVITEFGYSTSRASSVSDITYNELEQGHKIVNDIETMKKVGINNFVLYEWHDEWDKSIWNTLYSTTTTESQYWHDVETSAQSYGVYTFDSLINGKKMLIDGNVDDWNSDDLILNETDYSLYSKYDLEYLYIMVKGNKLDDIYIPIDVTNKSGSSIYQNMTFDRDVDFIIHIKENNSKILVQDYYNSLRAIYGKLVYHKDQFEKNNIPSKNSSNFEDILLITSFQKLNKDAFNYEIINEATTYNTGKLVYGTSIGNSINDYYIKDNVLEIRIPWYLLNFYNPAKMEIHDDYYAKYGVEPYKINEIYIGVGNDNIKLSKINLNKKNKIEYVGRIKDSYQIIKEYLGDE